MLVTFVALTPLIVLLMFQIVKHKGSDSRGTPIFFFVCYICAKKETYGLIIRCTL